MVINGLKVDVSRGFDVMRGKRVMRHFDSYAEACAYASEAWGRYVRYWEAKE
jgi:hypothetical protein